MILYEVSILYFTLHFVQVLYCNRFHGQQFFSSEIFFCNIKATDFTTSRYFICYNMKIAHFSRELFYA